MSACRLPPIGWRCTSEAGHDGPCPTVSTLCRTANCTGCDTCFPRTGSMADYMRPSQVAARAAAKTLADVERNEAIRAIVREEIAAALAPGGSIRTAIDARITDRAPFKGSYR